MTKKPQLYAATHWWWNSDEEKLHGPSGFFDARISTTDLVINWGTADFEDDEFHLACLRSDRKNHYEGHLHQARDNRVMGTVDVLLFSKATKSDWAKLPDVLRSQFHPRIGGKTLFVFGKWNDPTIIGEADWVVKLEPAGATR